MIAGRSATCSFLELLHAPIDISSDLGTERVRVEAGVGDYGSAGESICPTLCHDGSDERLVARLGFRLNYCARKHFGAKPDGMTKNLEIPVTGC